MSIWAIGGQLLAIGVVGEYIGKIYLETKARLRYRIETEPMTGRRSLKRLRTPTMRSCEFLLVGVVNTLAGMGIMFGLYNAAGCSYWASSAANYVPQTAP